MAHSPKPFFKASRNTWYVELDRKQVKLGLHPAHLPPPVQRDGRWEPPQEVLDEFYRVMAEWAASPVPTPKPTEGTSVLGILDKFLAWCKENRAPRTYERYHWRLQSFIDYLKTVNIGMGVQSLKPFHLDEWLERHPDWSSGMKHGACRSVQRAMRWAEKRGRIDRSPVAGYEKPRPGKRKVIISPAEFDQILGFVKNEQFKDLLVVSWETGCRPQESLRVEARHVDLLHSRWVLPPDEAKGEEWPRIVYLTERALEVTRRLMLKHPEGPLFRNTQGRPVTPYCVNCSFCRLQKKVGKKFCLYNLRHSWLDRALKSGIDSLTCAVLMGHRDPSTISRVYQHLTQSPEYLQNAAKKAVS